MRHHSPVFVLLQLDVNVRHGIHTFQNNTVLQHSFDKTYIASSHTKTNRILSWPARVVLQTTLVYAQRHQTVMRVQCNNFILNGSNQKCLTKILNIYMQSKIQGVHQTSVPMNPWIPQLCPETFLTVALHHQPVNTENGAHFSIYSNILMLGTPDNIRIGTLLALCTPFLNSVFPQLPSSSIYMMPNNSLTAVLPTYSSRTGRLHNRPTNSLENLDPILMLFELCTQILTPAFSKCARVVFVSSSVPLISPLLVKNDSKLIFSWIDPKWNSTTTLLSRPQLH